MREAVERVPRDVPAEAYERIDKTKPSVDQLEARWRELREAGR